MSDHPAREIELKADLKLVLAKFDEYRNEMFRSVRPGGQPPAPLSPRTSTALARLRRRADHD